MKALHRLFGAFALLGASAAVACGDGASAGEDSGAASDTSGTGEEGGDEGGSEGEEPDPGDPPPPIGGDEELCDAGDEAWVARALTFIQGRKPEGQREVRLYVQLLDALREQGEDDPRRVVAEGMARGDWYESRWETFFFEQVKVNRIHDKLNRACYAETTNAALDDELASFIRDSPAADSNFGSPFTAADVMRSSLKLDDISPFYRADMFARMARPLFGANVTDEDLDVMRRTNYGEIFEDAYLGRKALCLECHNSASSVTYSPDPELNRHWALPGLFERAVYGEDTGRDETEVYAAFRWFGFVNSGNTRPWGMSSACGQFTVSHSGDLLGDPGYLGGPLPEAPNLFDLEPKLRSGFADLTDVGLDINEDMELPADQAMAYLTAVTISNAVWKEAQGKPLVLANRFPRNEPQRDLLQDLAENFIERSYSLRGLVADVVTHPYFNQAPPSTCTASSAYHLDPIFDPFSIQTTDATAQRNGVGDLVHRHTSWVLLDSVSQLMWWDRPERFGPAGQDFDYPPERYQLLGALGVFLKDALPASRTADFYGLLFWEDTYAPGFDPGLGGACTGPLGMGCAEDEYIAQLLDEATSGDWRVEDVYRSLKDRLLLDPVLHEDELPPLEELGGLDLQARADEVDFSDLRRGARRYVGVLVTTPQFMLDGIPAPVRDYADRARLTVPGTNMKALCEATMPLVIGDSYDYSCVNSGVELE